jgi:hypothetical protein
MAKTLSYQLAQSQGFQTVPGLLAKGTQPNLDFPPMQDMYAGDSDVVTDRATAGAAILFRQAIARKADGTIVPWDPNATASIGVVHATGTLTFSAAPTAADTVTIAGHVITAEANAATLTGLQYHVGTDATTAGDNFAAVVNANTDTLGVTAVNAAGVVTLTANAAGTGGNAITTTESGTNTAFGAGTLSGGTNGTAAAPQAKMIGVALQDAVLNGPAVYATGGYFNHAWIIWPVQIDTLALRQLAVDGSNLQVGAVL